MESFNASTSLLKTWWILQFHLLIVTFICNRLEAKASHDGKNYSNIHWLPSLSERISIRIRSQDKEFHPSGMLYMKKCLVTSTTIHPILAPKGDDLCEALLSCELRHELVVDYCDGWHWRWPLRKQRSRQLVGRHAACWLSCWRGVLCNALVQRTTSLYLHLFFVGQHMVG